MSEPRESIVLCIDDDRDFLNLLERHLRGENYRVLRAESGPQGLELARSERPDLILLDVMMPGMDGYEVCAHFQEDEAMKRIPVIFLTGAVSEQNRVKALAAGAVDFLEKPLQRDMLLSKIAHHLEAHRAWKDIHPGSSAWDGKIGPSDFGRFRKYLAGEIGLSPERVLRLEAVKPSDIYAFAEEQGIGKAEMAQRMARFLDFPYLSLIEPSDILLGVMPTYFARSNSVVAIQDGPGRRAFVLSNPFDWTLIDTLKKFFGLESGSRILITDPENIRALFQQADADAVKIERVDDKTRITISDTAGDDGGIVDRIDQRPVVLIANNVLQTAVAQRASDIHIEPKENNTVVRFRVDGDMRDIFKLKKTTGVMTIARFKALGGLDIAERRKPQDGAVEAVVDGKTFKLRLATTSTPNGESLIMRLLDPDARPRNLNDLGMTEDQAKTMFDLARRNHGLVLIVGPTGAGKTTTIYSFLDQIDCRTRSLISVEDPVEYRIPFANQQQVNEKAGVTFEALLKSSVRQDPDILFIGEIRDPYSSKVAMDFASTGHLTITTLHTSTATTAIFRLERLGISRGTMADSLIGIVAQRLLKKLCVHCRAIGETTAEEAELLRTFTEDIPARTGRAVGCPKCNNSGYFGREAIYEIIKVDAEIAEMVRASAPISEIRVFLRNRGGYLISDHVLEKVRNLTFSVKDAYEKVLVEETALGKKAPAATGKAAAAAPAPEQPPSILVVEDDEDNRKLIVRYLEGQGYRMATAADGVDALLSLGQHAYDLVLSDVNMPNLDGFKLLELIQQKGISTPVVLLTARTGTDDEVRGFELGAADYIKKPISKDVLLLRVRKILGKKT